MHVLVSKFELCRKEDDIRVFVRMYITSSLKKIELFGRPQDALAMKRLFVLAGFENLFILL